MNDPAVRFDDVRERVASVLAETEIPKEAGDIHLVRDLFGKVRVCASDGVEDEPRIGDSLKHLVGRLSEALGPYGFPPDKGVLFMSAAMLETFKGARSSIGGLGRVYWVERLLTGRDWWTVGTPRPDGRAKRWTLYSVKGGVGRSTTAAILAWHLARKGERVLVADLDLESPGLSSAMFDPGARPEFGIADWFVEDLVDQSDRVIADMTATPAWARNFEGNVHVAPAYGRAPGEYLAKLGRAYMDRPKVPWIARLERLLKGLEDSVDPTFVLVESRNGLHDIAAATVTDIGAYVLLFATDSESSWTDYEILFDHWRDRNLATKIRNRLSIVSALTPELETERYLQRFQQHAWDLFRDRLYDDLSAQSDSSDEFSFDLDDEDAPHAPIAVHWTRGLAAGVSLRNLDETTVEQAYTQFLRRFDALACANDRGEDR